MHTLAVRWLLLLCMASPALAESAFVLEYPDQFGQVEAATYDDEGRRIGDADLLMERLDSGRVRMRVESGASHGARTTARVELAPKGPGLQVLLQESQSHDPDGRPLGIMTIDHTRRQARCADSSGTVLSEIELPRADRILNVPMNLFFQPLVRGEQSSLEFQLFVCRPNARVFDFVAWAADPKEGAPLEIRYGPDLGIASGLARGLAPKLSFWFDARAPHSWMGHRLPLYSGGPEVFVVRGGVASTSLVD